MINSFGRGDLSTFMLIYIGSIQRSLAVSFYFLFYLSKMKVFNLTTLVFFKILGSKCLMFGVPCNFFGVCNIFIISIY